MKKLLGVIVLMVLLSSCSQYQRLLKSTDYSMKYNKAMEYYAAEDYVRATTLFQELVNIFRGSDKAEIITFSYADALFGLRDYVMAGYYYDEIVRTYPASTYVEESQFQIAYCKYMQSPKTRLDQTISSEAISDFQLFINMFPNSSRVPEATRLMADLREKLVLKSYLSAKLYFDLGTHQGNNYLAAIIDSQNSLKEFPDTKYREELSFLILDAKFQQSEKSVEEKKAERYRETIDEYYSFINEFPQSKYLKKAKSIHDSAESSIKKL